MGSFLAADRKKTRKAVMAITWPVLVELLLSSLFGMLDMMMLGNMSDQHYATIAVAAVGIVNQPLFIGISLVQALNVGGTALIARFNGQGREDRFAPVLKHVILLAVGGLAIPYFIFAQSFAQPIMRFVGASDAVVEVGTIYFRIVITGFVFQSMSMAMASALRGIGETKIPMYINVFSNLLDVIGNAVLIYGLLGFPQMGIVGAGLTTAFSQFLSAVLMFFFLVSGRSRIHLNRHDKFKFDKKILKDLVKIGIPASGEQLIMRVGLLAYVRIVASLGDSVYAGHQIALSILGLSFNPGQAFGIAASTLVGRSLGEGRPERAEEFAKEARFMGSMVAAAVGLMFILIPSQLAGLYNRNPEVVAAAAIALRITGFIQPFQSSQLILSGALRGAGDTMSTMFATIIGILIIRVSLAMLFVNVFQMGIAGAWYATFIDQFVRWIYITIRFKRGRWKQVAIRA